MEATEVKLKPLHQVLISELRRRERLRDTSRWPDEEVRMDCEEHILEIMAGAPSGSGIDNGTKLMYQSPEGIKGKKGHKPERLQFQADYHHMNDGGMYDGWTEHVVTVEPDLELGFVLSISGRDRNDIKEYLHDVYYTWLTTKIPMFRRKE